MNEGAAKTLSGAPGNFRENGHSFDLKMGGLGQGSNNVSKCLPFDVLISIQISTILNTKLKTI